MNPAYHLSPQELRKELPVAWVADHLELRAGAETGQYFCPYHDDRVTPNLGCFVGRDGDHRFYCFNCGARGDAVDMLMQVGGLPWGRALNVANAILRGGEDSNLPKPQQRAEDVEPDAVALDLARRSIEPYLGSGLLPYAYGIIDEDAPAPTRALWDRHLYDRWQWALDGHGRILIPHRDQRGRLEAVKARKRDKAWRCYGRPQGLYGRWIEQEHDVVVLCEGESDTVTADLVLQGLADVRGLPKGAGHGRAHPVPEALAVWRTTIIAFDEDEAGIKARTAWMQAMPSAQHLSFQRGMDFRKFERAFPGQARDRIEHLLGL